MKNIRVSAAVIMDGERIFAVERGYGEWKGYWEFPGGKREEGESGEETIRREIKEELDTLINVEDYLSTVEYDYPTFHLTMDTYIANVQEGRLTLLEHKDAIWITKDEIESLKWLPADRLVVEDLKKYLESRA
ncbi:MAG: (deoxy)nucleoside triphosphate pyrophosphohydrolase [Candidatus Ornithospirochaeta sp.]